MADDSGGASLPRPRRRRADDPAQSMEPAADPSMSTVEPIQGGVGIPTSDRKGWLPMLDDRSPDPTICPFLRAIDDEDELGLPVEAPDPANRCAALREPVPQSLRQQELVCLTAGARQLPALPPRSGRHHRRPDPVVRTGPDR